MFFVCLNMSPIEKLEIYGIQDIHFHYVTVIAGSHDDWVYTQRGV